MISEKNKIAKLAARNGIVVIEDSMEFNESGLDYRVVFAEDTSGEEWVLRIPRRDDVIASAGKEKQILNFISPHIAVQIPQWFVFSDELIAYKKLNGVPAGTIDQQAGAYVWVIDEKNVPDVFNKTLAEGMASLHQINQINDAASAGLKKNSIEEIRETLKNRIDDVRAEFPVSESLWIRWQNWIENDAIWPRQTGLIHGDLHAGHILIDKEFRVTGFIDWTEASINDTSIDFAAHYRTFGDEALKRLIIHYENAGGYVWPHLADHVIERTAAYPVEIAEFALKSGLDEYVQMAKDVLMS